MPPMTQATLHITNVQVGTNLIYPYAREQKIVTLPIYRVPLYRMTLGTASFKAVRFGLTNVPEPAPAQTACNVGLSQPGTYFPTCIPYRTHSFHGKGTPIAWRLIPGKQFLIHEGTLPEEHTVGGSLGCVELAGTVEWQRFLQELQKATGAMDFFEMGRRRLLKVVVDAAVMPTAVEVGELNTITGHYDDFAHPAGAHH